MTRFYCIVFLALATVFIAAPAIQAQYTIEQTIDAGYNPWIKGQSFTPNIGVVPNPGSVSTLDLATITLYRSAQGWSGPTSNFYLNIYDGDPVNGAGKFIGSSIDRVDVATLKDFDPIKWTFDNLALDYTHEYWALVSSTNTSGGFDVYCGMRESGQTDPYTGGTSIAGITSDPSGYHVKATIDLAFKIELELGALIADTDQLSESTGGQVNLSLNAGLANAGRFFLILGTVSGTAPGTPLPGGMATLPINWDIFTGVLVDWLNSPIFQNFLGALDANGQATAVFDTNGPIPGSLGLTFNFAYACNKPWDFVSNPVPILVVP